MQLPDNLTPEQSEAVVSVLIELARHGRQLRLARQTERQKKESSALLGEAGADDPDSNGTNQKEGDIAKK